MDPTHELAETRKELAEVRKSMEAAVSELRRKGRRSLVGNYVVGSLLVVVVGLVGWFFIDDHNDDRATAKRREAAFREECEQDNRQSADIREGLTVFTDALVAAAGEEADPLQIEAFRRDLQARLAEAVPDRLCDAEAEARRLGHRLSVEQFERLYP